MGTLIYILFASFFIHGCGGNGGSDGGNTESRQTVPLCGDTQDGGFANARLLVSDEQISRTDADTKIRIWHTANSDKFICVLRGEAIIIEPQ